jgi:hypothetical protein
MYAGAKVNCRWYSPGHLFEPNAGFYNHNLKILINLNKQTTRFNF